MPAIPTPATIDPLSAFIAGASSSRGQPIPLVSTRFDVDIDGGLATVVTKRVFRNDETESIEATVTFPVPVHAVLFDLEARIDGRVVKARASRRTQARKVYEGAIARGKAAVLHEEILRGVHMLSVAHLGPGKEIEVTSSWAVALSFVGDQGQLRIPLTAGDIYGRSGLPDSDDLMTGGLLQMADLGVRCRNGVAVVRGASLDGGHTQVALNAPIDLVVTNAAGHDLRGVAADGREVVLRISPHPAGDMALNVAILVDHSGSMNAVCSGRTGRITKHKAVIKGLRSVAQGLGDNDVIDLWEFDNQLAHVGSSHDPTSRKRGRQQLLSLIARLTHPVGGTEIGNALSGTIAASGAGDILLITDGNSHALDVHELARKGRRITVLLVGEDSLEANVGHLAALSGGDIFVAMEDDIGASLAAAIGSLRAPSERPRPIAASLDRVRVVHGNALLEVEWRPAAGPAPDALRSRSVAAMAARLALPVLDEERAAMLAETEGLVTHLTSLVLVDEEGDAQECLPATRKIVLPRPAATRMVHRCRISLMTGIDRYPSPGIAYSLSTPGPNSTSAHDMDSNAGEHEFEETGLTLSEVALKIDWDASPNRLVAGDLSALDPVDAALIASAAAVDEVVALAKQMKINSIVLVVALLAHSRATENRTAARIAKAILGEEITEEQSSLLALIDLT
jgi:hypothetical protein